jgi:hypothetical protein
MAVTIEFTGICTHLVKRSWFPGSPRLELKSGATQISHRVFIPKSQETHIPFSIREHVPLLIIPRAAFPVMHPDMTVDGDNYVLRLNGHAVLFDLLQGTSEDPHPGFRDLPHLWTQPVGRHDAVPRPRQAAVDGWSRHAAAYIDFRGDITITQSSKKNTIVGIVFPLQSTLRMTFKPNNNDAGAQSFQLADGATVTVSNQPEGSHECLEHDYLLHYLATTLDLCEDPPEWPQPDPTSDVYCSPATYP